MRDDVFSNAPPILEGKDHAAPSVFRPENLLREARRQKGLPAGPVPSVCVLDPDGDLVRQLRAEGRARPCATWACYHTELYEFELGGERIGIVGCAVGAAFAVLVAEQLFASGCRFLVSVTSAGQIVASGPTPYFVLIDRALRDEGTSYHYLPPSTFSEVDEALAATVVAGLLGLGLPRASRRQLDHRRAVPRDRDRHRGGPRREACSPSRWKRRRCTPSRGHGPNRSCASRTSPTGWPRSRATSRRGRRTALAMPSR